MNYKNILLLLLLLIIPLANAQCLDIKPAKASYLSGETFQAEITGDLVKPLTYNDIYFSYDGKEYVSIFTLQQISANRWIVFSDLSEKYGLNEFAVRDLICRENGTLKKENKKISFTVKMPLQAYYSSLIDGVKGKWSYLSVDEISQSVLALSDFSESANGKAELLKTNECWPKGNCSVKSTVLAIQALNSLDKNWIIDAQNSINIGLWKLITISDSGKDCKITVNNNAWNISVPSGTNEISLNLPDDEIISVSLDCNITAKISHTYLGSVHEFPLGNINNKKCWGKYYRSECDALATAYALQLISDSKAENWLLENAKSTEEIAYAYKYTQDSELKNWLVNNQHSSGYWSNSSLAISNKSDVYSIVSAINSLEGDSKAENWLRENLESFKLEEKALTLQIFKKKIEPLVSIREGFIQENSFENITLKISNKGIIPTKIKISMLNFEKNIELPARTTLSVEFTVPEVSDVTFSSIDLVSLIGTEERGYSIPAVIIPLGKTGSDVNLMNTTLPPDTPTLKTANFEFIQSIINETLNIGEVKTVNVSVKNKGSEKLTLDITVWGDTNVVDSFPSSVDVQPGATANIPVSFKTSDSNSYSGQITVESKGSSATIPYYVSAKPAVVSEKTCSELNGKICTTTCLNNIIKTKEGDCCLGECAKVQSSGGISTKTIGLIMVVLAIVIGAGFIFLKLRKPKRRSLEKVLEKIRAESKIPEPGERKI